MGSIYKALVAKEKIISVTGLGYVGLPLALEFAKNFKVIGFDINESRIEMMKRGIDPSNELSPEAFEGTDIHFTSKAEDLKKAHFHIIGVPTDINEHKVPNLGPLLGASASVGQALKAGDYVVYESTVYPGCTEEDCLPILEKESGLSCHQKTGPESEEGVFHLGYSPERIVPGDKVRTLTKILKIVSGNTPAATKEIARVYGHIIEAGIYSAPSIEVAEAAKVIENTQRDINIALMNELAMIFDKMNIDTSEVLEAAGTKWNFLKFYPGLVGGHCIGVDPYYLTYKAQKVGYIPNMILSGRKTNEEVPYFIANKLIKELIRVGKNPGACRVLVKGLTFKENVADIRNTKVINVINELKSYSVEVDIEDCFADSNEVKKEFMINLTKEPIGKYDAIVVAVAHKNYKYLMQKDFEALMNNDPIVFDLKSIFNPDQMTNLNYWRL